jgi:two-component system, response regulator PdtaR
LAVTLEEDLISEGYRVIGPYSELNSAVQALRSTSCDFAVIDVNLNGELAYPLADELLKRQIPFVFLTGYASGHLPARFGTVPRFAKPYEVMVLLQELRKIAGRLP